MVDDNVLKHHVDMNINKNDLDYVVVNDDSIENVNFQ